VALKNPIGKIADAAIGSIKDPLGTAGKVVDQAKGTAALGKLVAEHFGKSAAFMAAETAGAVVERATGRKPSGPTETYAPDVEAPAPTLRSVPTVNEPGHTPAENRSEGPAKESGDPVRKAAEQAAKKTPAKKAPPAKKTTATPADVAEVVEAKAPAKKAAKKAATKAPATKAPATKAPAKKSAAKKSAAKKTVDPKTQAGTSAADVGTNPDTAESNLTQPNTEGIVEESTSKEVASKSAMMRKAAERNPE
jgi:hypothetical protein